MGWKRPQIQTLRAQAKIDMLLIFANAAAAAAAKSLQSCPTLCNPTDRSPPDSSVPGILQARVLEWAAISFSNTSMHAKSLQSCPALCNPMDCSPPGSSVHRILQAILEWVAISFSIMRCNAVSIPELGRWPGRGRGNPLQYSCLEYPMDRGAWQAAVHGVVKSRTRLRD